MEWTFRTVKAVVMYRVLIAIRDAWHRLSRLDEDHYPQHWNSPTRGKLCIRKTPKGIMFSIAARLYRFSVSLPFESTVKQCHVTRNNVTPDDQADPLTEVVVSMSSIKAALATCGLREVYHFGARKGVGSAVGVGELIVNTNNYGQCRALTADEKNIFGVWKARDNARRRMRIVVSPALLGEMLKAIARVGTCGDSAIRHRYNPDTSGLVAMDIYGQGEPIIIRRVRNDWTACHASAAVVTPTLNRHDVHDLSQTPEEGLFKPDPDDYKTIFT